MNVIWLIFLLYNIPIFALVLAVIFSVTLDIIEYKKRKQSR